MSSSVETGLERERIESLFDVLHLAADTAGLLRSFEPSDPDHHNAILADLDAIVDRHVTELRRRADLAENVATIVEAMRR